MTRGKIRTKQTVSILARVYAELNGRLRREPLSAPLRADIEHVAAVILLLDPSFDLGAVKPIARYKPNPLFRRGECVRVAMEILREAGGPLTLREIAIRALLKRGIAEPGSNMIQAMADAARTSFKRYAGTLLVEDRSTKPARWNVANQPDFG